ncbi:hypothetical protein [Nocardiopsis sp. FIRDI 009]|uniref:hypothetical protein n=1 Tax=Nocardiopsis sp. FIRDI 009 TaxID=714197 RepID=UPI0013002214|nr:hypothetical protein [Nocardiopsis sp. FIRDI 009]
MDRRARLSPDGPRRSDQLGGEGAATALEELDPGVQVAAEVPGAWRAVVRDFLDRHP